jgi:hypothetical protein
MARRLESSVASDWRANAAGLREETRSWPTRVGYYHAVVDALRHNGGTVDAGAIIHRHEHGRQSTFYALGNGKELLHSYRTHQSLAMREVGDLVMTGPVSQLIAETKVWSFWPSRQAWVQELDERNPMGKWGMSGQSLVRRLVQWQAENPELAAAQESLPPLCAVEDLMILSRNTVNASQAGIMLLRAVTSGELETPDGQQKSCLVLDSASRDDIIGRLEEAVRLLLVDPAGSRPSSVVPLLRSVARRLSTT